MAIIILMAISTGIVLKSLNNILVDDSQKRWYREKSMAKTDKQTQIWKEVDQPIPNQGDYLPFWNPEDENETISGTIINPREINSKFGGVQTIVDIGEYTVTVSKGLSILPTLVGCDVKLVYLGRIPVKKGMMKKYRIFVKG